MNGRLHLISFLCGKLVLLPISYSEIPYTYQKEGIDLVALKKKVI